MKLRSNRFPFGAGAGNPVYDKWLAKDFGAFVQSVIKTAGA